MRNKSLIGILLALSLWIIPTNSFAQVGVGPNGGVQITPAPYVNGSGNVKGPIYCIDGTAAAPCYSFASDTTLGFYAPGGHVISWSNTASQAGQLTSTGIKIFSNSGFIGFGTGIDVSLTRVADGKIQLAGSSNTTPMLLFGGSTSSFPALKRNGTEIDIRLGDDSANAPIRAGNIITSGTISLVNGAAIAISSTAPTISSGFGTNPSITSSNGTAAFLINIGTGGTASSGVIGLPTATTGWVVTCTDMTTPGVNATKQTASSTTTATVTNYNTTTGLSAAWTASDVIRCIAMAY